MKKKFMIALILASVTITTTFPVVCATEDQIPTVTQEVKEVSITEDETSEILTSEKALTNRTNVNISCKMPEELKDFEYDIYVIYTGEYTDFAVTLNKDNNFQYTQELPVGDYEIIMTHPTGGDYRFMTPYNFSVGEEEMNLYVYAMDGADFMNSDLYDSKVPTNLAEYSIEYAAKLDAQAKAAEAEANPEITETETPAPETTEITEEVPLPVESESSSVNYIGIAIAIAALIVIIKVILISKYKKTKLEKK